MAQNDFEAHICLPQTFPDAEHNFCVRTWRARLLMDPYDLDMHPSESRSPVDDISS